MMRTEDGNRTSTIGTFRDQRGTVAVLVELTCVTQFGVETPEVQGFAQELAAHIAVTRPKFVDRPRESLSSHPQTAESLYQQPYFRNPAITIGELMAEMSSRIGEELAVKRFVRYEVGEPSQDEQPFGDEPQRPAPKRPLEPRLSSGAASRTDPED